LIEAAIDAGLPTILSTGASTVEELRFAVDLFRRAGAMPRLILLHCVSCYPTPPDRLNLAAVATLRKTFGVPCGLSDHSTSTQTGAWAVAAGAFVVEKHLTLDPALDGPDHALSLNPEQFAEYVAQIRSCEQTLGDGRLGMQELERNVRLTASRSIVSSCDIPIGTVLTRDLLTLKRPGTGLGPTELSRLVGRRAATDIPADTVFSWDMVT
jgi:sialic acid synthase SpsE